MKKKRFAVEQIVAILKQAELGIPIAELIRQVGVSEQTFYRWKKKYSGLEIDQVRQAETDAGGECTPEAHCGGPDAGQGHAAGRVIKKALKPSRRRPVVEHWCGHYGVSQRRACRVTQPEPRDVSLPES